MKHGQDKWEVAIEPTATIAELKEAVSVKSSIPAENQRLIYSGKILKDAETVDSYKIQDGHSIHLVKSGAHKNDTSNAPIANVNATANATANASASAGVPTNLSAGQTGGFNPLNDLTSARYAGYLNMPSADMFGPDGGMNNAPNQDEMLRMMENPVFQSQMNEMLSNPQMIDFMIQSNPQLQAMGPQARQMLQSPMFRQMLTNPDMIRQSMQFANMMNPDSNSQNSFPAPGETSTSETGHDTNTNTNTNTTTQANPPIAGNPFAALFNPAAMGNPQQQSQQNPAFDPSFLASLLQGSGSPAGIAAAQPADNRPPEERYETQLRQLNDMGFFDFDQNVTALRRSGGSVQGALDALLNGDV